MATKRPAPADFCDPPTEIWTPLTVGITDLELSNHGRMRYADEKQRPVRYIYEENDVPKFNIKYRTVRGGFQFTSKRSVPKMVAEHFLPKSELPRIRHKDGDKINCRADNLEYVDYPRKAVLPSVTASGPTIDEMYASGAWTYDYAVHKHKVAKVKSPFTMERRPDLPGQDHLPEYLRRSVPLAEWEAQKTYNTPAPQPEQPPPAPAYPLSTEPQLDAHGNALPTPFPVIPEKLPEEDERDIEGSGLYFSQARAADKAYLTLLRKEDKTPIETAAFKNLKRVLDYD